jgi:hydroxyethylthiazole kinase
MRDPEVQQREDIARFAAALIERLRARRPAVHCVTNAVAQNFTANVLLAAGCVPSMTLSPDEIGDFVAHSNALLVNLGTFDRERRKATERAVETARRDHIPWVLDPVFVDRAAHRADFAEILLTRGPKALRLNRAEFGALAGGEPTKSALMAYAHEHDIVVGLSGETDWIADDTRVATVANGHTLMAKVTAMGCAVSALVAACLAVEADAWRATAAALTIMGVAGEVAGAKAAGPGSFAVAIIDVLHNLDAPALAAHARVTLHE